MIYKLRGNAQSEGGFMNSNKHGNDKNDKNRSPSVNRNESFGIGKEKFEKGTPVRNPGSGRGGTRI